MEVLVLVIAFGVGSIPFSNLLARRLKGLDLRRVGTGTVSGTALYRVTGFGPLAVAGVLDIAKGTAGPLLAGADRPLLATLAGGAAVAGHNWSPWLAGAGGRGLSPALGALAVLAWPGVVVLGVGLAAGRLARRTGLGTFVSLVALVPTLAVTHGRWGAAAGLAATGPIMVKRLLGNRPGEAGIGLGVYLNRLVFDRDDVG